MKTRTRKKRRRNRRNRRRKVRRTTKWNEDLIGVDGASSVWKV
jgi:hypothetical protein